MASFPESFRTQASIRSPNSRRNRHQVLVLGYCHSDCRTVRDQTDSVKLEFINTTSNVFKSPSWSLFHKRVGDDFVAFLLKNCSVFQSLSNRNYLQLAGASLSLKHNLVVPVTSSSQGPPRRGANNSTAKLLRNRPNKRPRAPRDLAPSAKRVKSERETRAAVDDRALASERATLLSQSCTKFTPSLTPSANPAPPPKRPAPPSGHQPASNRPPTAPSWCAKTPAFCKLLRHKIFYYNPHASTIQMPKEWILAQLDPTTEGARTLVRHVFSISHRLRIPPRINSFLPIAKSIIQNSKKILLCAALQKYAPIKNCGPTSPSRHHPHLLPPPRAPLSGSSDPPSRHRLKTSPLRPKRSSATRPPFPNRAPRPRDNREPRCPVLSTSPASPHRSSHPLDDHYENLLLQELIDAKDVPLHWLIPDNQLPNCYVPHYDAFLFVRHVVRSLLPRDLLCSAYNWSQFESSIDAVIRLGRFEQLFTEQIFNRIKLNHVVWLYKDSRPSSKTHHLPPSDMYVRRNLMLAALKWIFNEVIFTLLRGCFYCTETAPHKLRVFYYRREVWSRIHRNAVSDLSLRGVIQRVESANVEELLHSRLLGLSYFRFLPKKNGVRPIVNFRRKRANPFHADYAPSINDTMKVVQEVLTFEQQENKDELMASGVLKDEEVYHRLSHFKQQLQKPDGALPKLYFVKVDLERAYDNIKQTRLFELISNDVLHLEHYLRITWSQTRVDHNQCKCSWKKKIFHPSKHPQFPHVASELSKRLRHVIFTDGVKTDTVRRDDLLDLLYQHIFFNIIRDEKRYYKQAEGVSQGSTTSALLCSLYYAHLERNELREFSSPSACPPPHRSDAPGENWLLLHWIDDFLFVTTNPLQAKSFADKMHAGFADYGCYCNPSKTVVNFDHACQNKPLPKCHLQSGDAHPSILWCGWALDTLTLDVQRDFSFVGRRIRDSLTRVFSPRPGKALLEKINSTILCKAHPMLFDASFNSSDTILLNSFHILLLAMIKLCCLDQGSYQCRNQQAE
ncbi:uncharacterized protein LOC126318357 [Schistocerca gregaria]|uniref:uncharacterized protein LOC126318357 n=1 Tax=Schistocerca gregaria TaxID=7010 RepID=UPI00211E155E|nr:uncharacterized protein LOC126318357 [Schistocerca gregaria]